MGWELANSWDELQFVNYGHSEEFQDGRIGFWRLEDWEICGPGAGGYTSSGPFGSVEGDYLRGSRLKEEFSSTHCLCHSLL